MSGNLVLRNPPSSAFRRGGSPSPSWSLARLVREPTSWIWWLTHSFEQLFRSFVDHSNLMTHAKKEAFMHYSPSLMLRSCCLRRCSKAPSNNASEDGMIVKVCICDRELYNVCSRKYSYLGCLSIQCFLGALTWHPWAGMTVLLMQGEYAPSPCNYICVLLVFLLLNLTHRLNSNSQMLSSICFWSPTAR